MASGDREDFKKAREQIAAQRKARNEERKQEAIDSAARTARNDQKQVDALGGEIARILGVNPKDVTLNRNAPEVQKARNAISDITELLGKGTPRAGRKAKRIARSNKKIIKGSIKKKGWFS